MLFILCKFWQNFLFSNKSLFLQIHFKENYFSNEKIKRSEIREWNSSLASLSWKSSKGFSSISKLMCRCIIFILRSKLLYKLKKKISVLSCYWMRVVFLIKLSRSVYYKIFYLQMLQVEWSFQVNGYFCGYWFDFYIWV